VLRLRGTSRVTNSCRKWHIEGVLLDRLDVKKIWCNMRWKHPSFYTILYGVADETKRLDIVRISFSLAFELLLLVTRDLDDMCEII
jgi:hypothetical protein